MLDFKSQGNPTGVEVLLRMEAAGISVLNTEGATDAELVAWARAGDDAAFGELFRRYRPRVTAFVNGIVRDESRAEDVTQEAFLSALRRLRETDGEIAFKPWIFRIARNASIDLYRRGSRAEEVSFDPEATLSAAEADRLPRQPAPDSSLLDKERFDHLRGALAELSDSHHRIIVLRELEGLSYREIAARMEITPAAVESTLFRARRKLEHEYVQIDTGRRCQSIGALIARLAEGFESARERRRLDRHARRCVVCRRRARELGVEPVLERGGAARRVAALLPLPAILKRRDLFDGPSQSLGAGAQHAAPLNALIGSGLDAGALAGKAVATVAVAALVGGGGATLGGVGPIADAGGAPQAAPHPQGPPAASERQQRTLLLDGGLGRPLPARPAPVARKAPGSKVATPRGQVGAPSGPAGSAPAAPEVKLPGLPAVPLPGLGPKGASDPRGQLRPPPAPAKGAPGIPQLAAVAKGLETIDVQALLRETTARVSRALTPPK